MTAERIFAALEFALGTYAVWVAWAVWWARLGQ